MLDWFCAGLSLIGILLNAKKNILCWPVWIVSNIAWLIYIFGKSSPEWALAFTWLTFGLANIYGWIEWKKDERKVKQQ